MLESGLENSWYELLQNEFKQDYFKQLEAKLAQEKQRGLDIFPSENFVFNAFNRTPFPQVKVVILGQDPYHGPGQAHGLAFSVPDGVRLPPSLKNIFKEIQSDLNQPTTSSGKLDRWADQGVLLLNTILTVRANEAASHRSLGWETFTDYNFKNERAKFQKPNGKIQQQAKLA